MKQEQTLWDEIQSLPNDPDYQEVLNMPIPLGKSVLIKKVKQEIVQLGGIIIPDAQAENSQQPKVGLVQAIGPLCTKGLKVGLRVYHNHFANLEVRINGVDYLMMDENDVYYILRSNQQKITYGEGVIPAKEVRRAKSIAKADDYVVRKHKSDMNEKDQKQDKTKGKTFAIHFKPKNK